MSAFYLAMPLGAALGIGLGPVIANRTATDLLAETQAALAQLPDVVVATVPESPVLSAPTVRAQAAAVDAELVLGTDSWLDRESQGLIVAAMSFSPRPRPMRTAFWTPVTPTEERPRATSGSAACRSGVSVRSIRLG